MISEATALPKREHKPFTRKQSVLLVFLCTIFGAAAQVLMKTGAGRTHGLIELISNVPLIAGYALYGINTLLLMLALRDGELSLLYPVIALTYVWVNVLSVFVFHEQMNVFKIGGIVAIIAGVAVLGRVTR